ncbi:hypothetical protein J1605_021273 [Eschrichtius robustus]|uniref:RAD51D N-terminal domain-containing protein n=1 Tax=Eschrichtius robustus TaxID=9764 RepID=A0AB34HI52_ESCRO|nr:hypothetical protein J1605_021273 [Eschrichtius robustus]
MGVLQARLCPGLTQDMVQLLRSCGMKTVMDLVSADLEEFSAFPFSGTDLYEELKTSTAILSTGIGSLDNCSMLVSILEK